MFRFEFFSSKPQNWEIASEIFDYFRNKIETFFSLFSCPLSFSDSDFSIFYLLTPNWFIFWVKSFQSLQCFKDLLKATITTTTTVTTTKNGSSNKRMRNESTIFFDGFFDDLGFWSSFCVMPAGWLWVRIPPWSFGKILLITNSLKVKVKMNFFSVTKNPNRYLYSSLRYYFGLQAVYIC